MSSMYFMASSCWMVASRRTWRGEIDIFELEAVTAVRGGARVLDGLSVAVDEGATGVIGPSGAGKSTLLRLLNRLADPISGVVRYRGRDVRELDVLALRREVALVPQLPALLE